MLVAVEIEVSAHSEETAYEDTSIAKEYVFPQGVAHVITENTHGEEVTHEREAVSLVNHQR